MSTPAETFRNAFGAPEPSTALGVQFHSSANQGLVADVGAGWFRHGFLYLFGEELAQLNACLEAWPFVVPSNPRRIIIGRNAYGAILVVDNESMPREERVFVLDPFTVSYTEVPNARFMTLMARALPGNELPRFLDDSAYHKWRAEHGVTRLEPRQVLGVKVPRSLGGELVPANLQLEDIVSYYQTTGTIYAKAFATLSKDA